MAKHLHERDLRANPRFVDFRAQLTAKGFSLRSLWQARANKDFKFPDVECFLLIGPKRPAIGVIVVKDYGDDGFGLFFESQTVAIEADVATIIGS